MLKGKCMKGAARLAVYALGIFTLLTAARAQGATAPPPPRPSAPATCVRPSSATLPAIKQNTVRTSQTLRTPVPFEVRWMTLNIQLRNRIVNQCKTEILLTTNTTLKTFATNLSTSATAEATQMTAWLKTWYSTTVTAPPAPPTPVKDPVVCALKNQDLVFINQVLMYEQSAIGSAVFPAALATHADLKAFAKKMIANGQATMELVWSWDSLLINIDLAAYFK